MHYLCITDIAELIHCITNTSGVFPFRSAPLCLYIYLLREYGEPTWELNLHKGYSNLWVRRVSMRESLSWDLVHVPIGEVEGTELSSEVGTAINNMRYYDSSSNSDLLCVDSKMWSERLCLWFTCGCKCFPELSNTAEDRGRVVDVLPNSNWSISLLVASTNTAGNSFVPGSIWNCKYSPTTCWTFKTGHKSLRSI